MSEIRLVQCERCRRQADAPRRNATGTLVRPPDWKVLEGRDLCPECYAGFRAWLEGPHPVGKPKAAQDIAKVGR